MDDRGLPPSFELAIVQQLTPSIREVATINTKSHEKNLIAESFLREFCRRHFFVPFCVSRGNAMPGRGPRINRPD